MCASSDDGGVVGEGDGDDITLCGLSECDTQEAEERLSEFEDESTPCRTEEPSVCVYQQQLDDLARENVRLSKENSSLKIQVTTSDEESIDPSCDVEVGSHPVVSPPQLHYYSGSCQGVMGSMYNPAMWQTQCAPQPQGMGAWWFPAMMPNQMVAVMANDQIQIPRQEPQARASQGPRRSRRSKASGVIASGKSINQEESSRRTRALDRILPDPVAPMPELADGKHRTTVMLRNMPNNYSPQCWWSYSIPRALRGNMISFTFPWISSPALHLDTRSSISQAAMLQHLFGILLRVTQTGQSQAER